MASLTNVFVQTYHEDQVKGFPTRSSSLNLSMSSFRNGSPSLSLSRKLQSSSNQGIRRSAAANSQLRNSAMIEGDTSDTEDSQHILVDSQKITQIHSKKGLEEALSSSGDDLVVIKYGASHSINCARIYPTIVELSQKSVGVKFLLIIGDESSETEELCKEANITSVPYFKFLKSGKVIHEEKGVDPEQMYSNVMYYSQRKSSVVDLHGEEDVEALVKKHEEDHSLVVVDISLNHCGPCARIWPTVVKLADQMEGSVTFAKMDGDENQSTRSYLKKMNVKEVPTFLFLRDGKMLGKYVGSGRGDLIGEVLRYQGVRCT